MCRILILSFFGITPMFGQSRVELFFEGIGFDTSSFTVGLYENVHVQPGFPPLKSFQADRPEKRFIYELTVARVFHLQIDQRIYRFYAEPGDLLYLELKENHRLAINGTRKPENDLLFRCFGDLDQIDLRLVQQKSLADGMSHLDSLRESYHQQLQQLGKEVSKSFSKYFEAEITGFYHLALSNLLKKYSEKGQPNLTEEDRVAYYKAKTKVGSIKLFDEVNSRAYLNAVYFQLIEGLNARKNGVYTYGLKRYIRTVRRFAHFDKLRKHFVVSLASSLFFLAENESELRFANEYLLEIDELLMEFPATRQLIIQEANRKSESLQLVEPVEFKLLTPDLHPESILTSKSPYLILSFWASWCEPCLRNQPALSEYIKENDNRLRLNLVNIFDTKEKWLKILNTNQPHPSINHFHADKEQSALVSGAYGFESVPQYILIDTLGRSILYRGTSFVKLMESLERVN